MRLRVRDRRLLAGAVVAALTVAVVAIVVSQVTRQATEDARRIPEASLISDCPEPSGGPPPVPTIGADRAGPLLTDQAPDSAQLCPGIRGGDVAFRGKLQTGLPTLLAAINELPEPKPGATCPSHGPGEVIDLVITYETTRVVVQINTGDCGVVHHDGIFRYGGKAVVELIRTLLETR